MKPSHITTPRTMAECTFTVGYTSGQPQQYDREDRIVMWAALVVSIALAAILVVERLA